MSPLTRRQLLGSAGAGAAGVGLGAGGYLIGRESASSTEGEGTGTVSFHGEHQAGIATPAQDRLHFAAFDLTSERLADLRELMVEWSLAAAEMTAGQLIGDTNHTQLAPADDTGETVDLRPSRLTVTFGFGPTLFERDGSDRLGLRSRRPRALRELPPLPADELVKEQSGGDLCVQACAEDTDAMRRFVWLGGADRPKWMRGGTFMVTRRIRMLLEVWDRSALSEQEQTIGRRKYSGAPLGERHEFDRVNLAAEESGQPVIPVDAHVRLASSNMNEGERILRRGYSFTDGVDERLGELDAGLFFICFQRDPHRQFVAIQRRLGSNDALNEYIKHVGSAIFAVPPGSRPGGYVGQVLLG